MTIGEDANDEQSIGVYDTNVAIFTVTVSATSSNTNLISNASLGVGGSGTNRLLTLSPRLHQSGSATITVTASDSEPASFTTNFTLTVTPTNYPPVFVTTVGDQSRNENSPTTNWSFTISDIETPASSLTVTATSSNTTLVPNNNLVISGSGANRTVTLTQATNQSGLTQIELVVTDGGGATATNDFVLDVLAVNQPPTFTMASSTLTYDENFGLVTLSNFVTGVTSGPANQSSESNYFALLYTTNFYAQAPALDTNGTLTFQAATNGFGTNVITFVLTTTGSTTNGGKNSLTNSVTLNVPFVNQPPTNTFATNLLLVGEDSPVAFTNVGFLTNLAAGPANESNQTWFFTTITQTNAATNAQFTMLPTNGLHGTLFFQPALHSFGTNWVSVIMTDSGGTNNGGVNTYSNAFQLGVIQTNHAPVIIATNFSGTENGGTNTPTVNVWDYDTDSSNLVLAATSLQTNLISVSITATNVASTTNAAFTLAVTPVHNANGTATVQLVATEGPLSTTNTFTVRINPVNQPPTYTFATNLLLVGEELAGGLHQRWLPDQSRGGARPMRAIRPGSSQPLLRPMPPPMPSSPCCPPMAYMAPSSSSRPCTPLGQIGSRSS